MVRLWLVPDQASRTGAAALRRMPASTSAAAVWVPESADLTASVRGRETAARKARASGVPRDSSLKTNCAVVGSKEEGGARAHLGEGALWEAKEAVTTLTMAAEPSMDAAAWGEDMRDMSMPKLLEDGEKEEKGPPPLCVPMAVGARWSAARPERS